MGVVDLTGSDEEKGLMLLKGEEEGEKSDERAGVEFATSESRAELMSQSSAEAMVLVVE